LIQKDLEGKLYHTDADMQLQTQYEEEINKFESKLNMCGVTITPLQRQMLLAKIKDQDQPQTPREKFIRQFELNLTIHGVTITSSQREMLLAVHDHRMEHVIQYICMTNGMVPILVNKVYECRM
jgi:hypothetical protein